MYTSLYRHCACSSVNALTFYQPHDHRPYYHLQGLLHDRMTPSDSHLGLFFLFTFPFPSYTLRTRVFTQRSFLL